MDVLDTLEITWETVPQYLDQLDRNLGVNVGNLIGHTAVRYYVMGDECQQRAATDDEIKQMQDLVRDGMKAGALGVSVSRNQGHFDPQGVHIPAIWAEEKEIFALGDVLRELGTGLIQSGGGNGAEMKDALMSRLSEATGRVVVYNNLGQTMRRPGQWQAHMAQVDATTAKGIRAYPMCTPNRITDYFQMRNTQTFRGMAVWHPICLSSPEEQLKSYADPEVRRKLHDEAVEFKKSGPAIGICQHMVGLHGPADCRAGEEQAVREHDPWPDRQGAGQGHHRLFPRLGDRGKPQYRVAARREQRRRCRRRQDPDLSERRDRPLGRRRACAVPERVRLLDTPAIGVGARERRSCRWRPRCGD